MAENTVSTVRANIYCGDAQALKLTPDVTDDDSGIDLDDWQVEVAFAYGMLQDNLVNNRTATIIVSLSYDAVDSFTGTIPASVTAGMRPGLWTMNYWRKNFGAEKLLLQVELMVNGTTKATTTSTTSTTTTTT